MRLPSLHERLSRHDAGWCLRSNHLCARGWVLRYFAVVSRLGNGAFWYTVMAILLLTCGDKGMTAAAHMAAIGVVGVALYKSLKRWTRRPRPFVNDVRIRAWVAPLDEFSFPSGHTLHAVSFTVVALAYYPQLAWVLIPFSASVAASRVVLGLHYPSDVLAATAIATLLATISFPLAALIG